jgi:hypothetical protein
MRRSFMDATPFNGFNGIFSALEIALPFILPVQAYAKMLSDESLDQDAPNRISFKRASANRLNLNPHSLQAKPPQV